MFVCHSEDWFIFILIKSIPPVPFVNFGIVTSDGDVMPPFIFPHGFIFNTKAYIKCLKKVELTWIEGMAAGRPYIR